MAPLELPKDNAPMTTDDRHAIRPGREPHPIAGLALTFDLAAEAAALRSELTWRERGHNAKTLVKHPDFRVVLVALGAGRRMQEHKTDQCVTVQALTGHLRLHLQEKALDLGPGNLVALGQTVVHDVEAVEDSVFLLSLGWSRAGTPAGV